jgi:PPM family protein phosphatase
VDIIDKKLTDPHNSINTEKLYMSLLCAGFSDIGKKRQVNQDSILVSPEHRLFIVADGMGGHKGGEVASSLATKHISEYLSTNADHDPVECSKAAINYANNVIKTESERNPEVKGMGTTVVQLLFKGSKLYISNLGDSRAYLINQGNIFQLTKDHSLVQEKVNIGIYSREQALKDQSKNVLSRTCGYHEEIEVDTFIYKVKKNDLFLLCSDGLSGLVTDHDIVKIINKFIPGPGDATQEDLEKTLNVLIKEANNNGGNDNISVIGVITT